MQHTDLIINWQNNQHPRDYIYEVSVQYQLARAIHFFMDIGLAAKIDVNGVSIDDLIDELKEYKKSAILDLIKFLAAYKLMRVEKNQMVYPTALTAALNQLTMNISCIEDEWLQTYSILDYFEINPEFHKFFSKNITLSLNANSIALESNEPQALVKELSSGHLLSRAIRELTETGFFEILFDNANGIFFDELIIKLKTDKKTGFRNLLHLLDRYKIIQFNTENDIVCPTVYSAFLSRRHPESMYDVMFMIDEKWWKAAAKIAASFKLTGKSAFEEANNESFYQAYLQNGMTKFQKGMAAISLLEDREVAQAMESTLAQFDTIVDIGGGDGGLLQRCSSLNESMKNKKYILFEKIPDNPEDYDAEMQNIRKRLESKSENNSDFNPDIILGDFTKPDDKSKLPKIKNAAYFIKCVLHNIPDQELIINIFKNINKCMGNESRLFSVERTMPEHDNPDMNRGTNFLMRILFKAESRNHDFYQDCMSKAGIKASNSVLDANHYQIVCSEGNPMIKVSALSFLHPKDTEAFSVQSVSPGVYKKSGP